MTDWLAKLLLTQDGLTRLLIENPEGDLLKARLPRPRHPRALLTLLEGAALWTGDPLCAAISVEGRPDPAFVADLFGEDWPGDSALVRFVAAVPRARARRPKLRGVGDFHQLDLLVPEVRRPRSTANAQCGGQILALGARNVSGDGPQLN